MHLYTIVIYGIHMLHKKDAIIRISTHRKQSLITNI